MRFAPPHYEWTATTAREALNILEAARDLINSHMKTLCPEGGLSQRREESTTPTEMRLTLDLSGIVQLINDRTAIKDIESAMDLTRGGDR